MAYTFNEVEPLIIRMTTEDRQRINQLIQHKRQEFESVMKKGVVAMLNAQEEHDKLAEKRTEYLSFLNLKTQRKKTELRQITSEARDVTRDAPMGIGTGAQFLLAGANAVGQTILDEGQQRRDEQEAEQTLFAAQMLYYIPPQEYEPIAARVAEILSYRYQFLIFRLAAGEDGYIKLAKFFLKSMKTYAISCLREQKSNVISALINAATPPSTDAFKYRDYPNIDFSNFRINLMTWGGRARLAMDEDVNKIVERCGPAVRAFIGSCGTYVNASDVKLKSHHEYTIIGMLNHAPILDVSGRVMAGLKTSQGQSVSLYGDMKYPMILLSKDETTAHLGVNFATRMTEYMLEPVHYEVLKRLVPNFLNHQSCYQLTDVIDIKQDNFHACRYSEERLECPWTAHREAQLHSRLTSMYASIQLSKDLSEREEIDGNNTHQMMWEAGHQAVLKLQYLEIQTSTSALLDEVRLLFDEELSESTQKRKKIYALNLAKEGSKTATQTLKFMLDANMIAAHDFNAVKRLIELVNLSIYACRSNLMQEAVCFDRALKANVVAQEQGKQISNAHQLSVTSFQLLGDLLRESNQDEQILSFVRRETQFTQQMIKYLKTQIRDNMTSIKHMIEVGEMIAAYDTDYANTQIDMSEAKSDFEEAIKQVRQAHQTQNFLLNKTMGDFFTEILFDANFYFQELKEAMRQEVCLFIETPDWVEGLSLANKSSLEKKEVVATAIKDWFSELKAFCQTANHTINQYSRLTTNRQRFMAELNRLKQEVTTRRDKIAACYHALSYESEEFSEVINAYLLRAKHQDAFSSLYFLASQSGCNIDELSISAKKLYLSYYQACALRAKTVGDEVIHLERIPKDIGWQKLKEISEIIRQAKESLESGVRDDIELVGLVHNQLVLLYREKFQSIQEMSDIEGLVRYFAEDYELVAISKPAQEKYFAQIGQKVGLLIEALRSLGIESGPIIEQISSAVDRFNMAWRNNQIANTQEVGIIFLAKLLREVNRRYCELYPLNPALLEIKKQKESVSLLLNQDPSELIIARKNALRAVKQAYRYIQKANERIAQNELGIVLPTLVKQSDLVRSILIWSSRLNFNERQSLDVKSAPRRQLQQTSAYKTPVRMLYSLFLVAIINQIAIKKLDVGRLRKIRNNAMKVRLSQTSSDSPSALTDEQLSMVDLKKSLLQLSKQEMLLCETQLNELQKLQSRMVSQSIKLFFMEWKRKVFDLPLEVVAFKKACHEHLVEDKKIEASANQTANFKASFANFHARYSTNSKSKWEFAQPLQEEENELEVSLDDLEEMLRRLEAYGSKSPQVEVGSPLKSSSLSFFSNSPCLYEDAYKVKQNL